MGEIQLSRLEAEHKGRLPPVCVCCGCPATQEGVRGFGRPWGQLTALIFVAFVRVPFGLLVSATQIPDWLKRDKAKMHVRLPVCNEHVPHWYRHFGLHAVSVTDETIVLKGVCGEFIEALAGYREANRARFDQESQDFQQPTDGGDFFRPTGR
jgi:hypothetical protein